MKLEKIHSLDPTQLVYKCDNTDGEYQLIIVHRFPEVDMRIEKLSYYITVNGNKVLYDNSDTSTVYCPDLISTVMDEDYSFYTSTYKIHSLNKLTQNTSNEVKINMLLPFDHETNILSITMFKIKNLLT